MFGKTAVVSLLIVCITAQVVISPVRDSGSPGANGVPTELGLQSKEVNRQGGVSCLAFSDTLVVSCYSVLPVHTASPLLVDTPENSFFPG